MITGLPSSLHCVYTHGTTTDILRVSFNNLLSSDIAALTTLSFTVEGVRGPPTTSAVTGFSFKTTSSTGATID